MNFVKTKKIESHKKTPFFKRKSVRITSLILGLFLVFIISFFSYIYANGSKIFEQSVGSSLIKMLTGEESQAFKDERINILVMGRGGDNHPGGLLTDSIMVVSMQTKEKKIAMMSIPRDLVVPIEGHREDKINTAYANGYNDYLNKNCKKKNTSDCKNDAMAAGANLTKKTVSDVFGIPINYYAVVDFVGFQKIIDEIGGVDVYVEKNLYDPFYPADDMKGYKPFNIKAGQQHLDGVTALKYARSRETTSDFDRARRQQQIISSIKEKTLKLGFLANPKKILDMVNIVGDHVRTNLSPTDIKDLASLIKDMDTSNIISRVLSNSNDGPLVSDSSTGTYYLRPKNGNYNQLKTIASNIFNETVEAETADIEVLNGSKISGAGGRLATALKSYGYTIVNIQSSKAASTKTYIYDYSNGAKKETLAFLKDALVNAEVVKKTRTASTKGDITILIGDNYKELTAKK